MSYEINGKVYRNIQEQVYENTKDINELSTGKTYRGPYDSLDAIDNLLVGGLYLISDSNGGYDIYRCDDADHKQFTYLGKFGAKGDKGDIGPAGPQGDIGPKGDVGPVGPQGERGLDGAEGPQGIPGPQGIQGPKGDTPELPTGEINIIFTDTYITDGEHTLYGVTEGFESTTNQSISNLQTGLSNETTARQQDKEYLTGEINKKQDKLDSYNDHASVDGNKLTLEYQVRQEDGTFSPVNVEYEPQSGGIPIIGSSNVIPKGNLNQADEWFDKFPMFDVNKFTDQNNFTNPKYSLEPGQFSEYTLEGGIILRHTERNVSILVIAGTDNPQGNGTFNGLPIRGFLPFANALYFPDCRLRRIYTEQDITSAKYGKCIVLCIGYSPRDLGVYVEIDGAGKATAYSQEKPSITTDLTVSYSPSTRYGSTTLNVDGPIGSTKRILTE